MKDRISLLRSLIQGDSPFEEVNKELSQYRWDSEELVSLGRSDVAAILKKYLDGKYTANELEEWANLIEGRDDIGFEGAFCGVISDLVHQLANPLLCGKLSSERVREMLRRLERTPL